MRGLQFRTIASYKTVVALPKNDPLARKSVVNLKDLAPRFFIGMSEASYPSYRDWLAKTCGGVGFVPEGLAGCRTGTDNDSRGGRRVGCGSRARTGKETRSRKCSLSAAKSNRQNGRLYCMEGRNSVGCSESVPGDRRARGPQHPLIYGMAGCLTRLRDYVRGVQEPVRQPKTTAELSVSGLPARGPIVLSGQLKAAFKPFCQKGKCCRRVI